MKGSGIMAILKLKPSGKDYLWGGHRLVDEYNKEYDGDILAETWELSCHPDGSSYIVNGEYAGKTLEQYMQTAGKEVWGSNCSQMDVFPVLIKFIDAKETLAIQVHPDNEYALAHEGELGKKEMWYIMEAGEGAFVYYGFKEKISRKEFEERIRDNTLTDILNKVPARKGDVFFIDTGTIHAIGENILVAEIQQNSNVTYRVCDFGRVGKDGRRLGVNIERSLEVTKLEPAAKQAECYPHIADCDYFTVDKLNLDGRMMRKLEGNVSQKSFVSILILDGEGRLADRDDVLEFRKGDSFFIPAGSGDYYIEGVCDALITSVRQPV